MMAMAKSQGDSRSRRSRYRRMKTGTMESPAEKRKSDDEEPRRLRFQGAHRREDDSDTEQKGGDERQDHGYGDPPLPKGRTY
jgi:hypothetical protein